MNHKQNCFDWDGTHYLCAEDCDIAKERDKNILEFQLYIGLITEEELKEIDT